MAIKQNFPDDIREAIVTACREAQTPHYGAHFIHCDDGSPTASLGRVSGGLWVLGISDDFYVGLENGQWAVWSNRAELLGLFGVAATLRAGLTSVIGGLYCKRMWRARRRMA